MLSRGGIMQWNFGDIIDAIVPILPEGIWRWCMATGKYMARNERADQ